MLREISNTKAAPDTPRITDQEAAAMMRAVMRLFEKWNMSDAEAREVLGGIAPRTYARWKNEDYKRIDRDLATRLSLLMGIHKGLRYLFSDPERGYAWVKKPNRAFGERTPAEIMTQGDIFSLARIRSYLDAERGGW